MSSRILVRLWITAATLAVTALPAAAQYQGQIDTSKSAPQMRAVAVLEWTGDEDHPKTSRLVPICVYDGQELEDASVYMSQPEPLALESDVEYQLMQDGKPVGLFVVSSAGQQQGSWIGFGKWRPLARPKPAPAQVAKIDADDDAQSDEPVLHRGGDAAREGSGGKSSGPGANAPAPDPDRPTLHKGGDTSDGGSGSSGSASASDPDRPTLHKGGDTSSDSSGGSSGNANAPPPDPDRPILRPDADSSANSASTSDADRPKLKKKKDDDDGGYVTDVATVSDPNRPHLFRGKTEGYAAPVLPSLVGLPADMHQEVAVSDAANRPVHVWDYSWANPDDEAKMKGDLEDLARKALGLNPPPAPAAKTTARRTTTVHKPAKPVAPAQPAPLVDEQFRVFELAYGGGATMVLSAHTAGSGEQEKFVTLIAQPDLYGNVAVLLKNVTDAAHLDDTPRMRLIDAVDAKANNRGDLLFELRGATQRQFALYRVLRGDATRIFLTSASAIASPMSN